MAVYEKYLFGQNWAKIRFWIPSDFGIQSWIFIKKHTLAETKKRKKTRANEAKAKECVRTCRHYVICREITIVLKITLALGDWRDYFASSLLVKKTDYI